jgi:hypothetical protein
VAAPARTAVLVGYGVAEESGPATRHRRRRGTNTPDAAAAPSSAAASPSLSVIRLPTCAHHAARQTVRHVARD